MKEALKQISSLVERFERNIEAYRSPAYNETQLRREFIDPFFEALGWDVANKEIEYMVLDACWKLATQLSKIQPKGYVPHGKRIEVLCQEFKIPPREDLIKDIVDFRNGLFHETLWDGSQPGTAVSNPSINLPSHLRRLNQRLIIALLGYKTPYIKTEWWFFGNYSFDQP